ncbi:MAG TPA: TfuA-related McrA-glycine thioamidation protein [Methanoregulaceae archaeon]|nr:TfuA-related McrA-glycine thioamidation protein [Methanoregulaceae archaeon]HRY75056.1 TfuA-related McrA-glycine thioamidation protein [Methanoregulaceae archaeon]
MPRIIVFLGPSLDTGTAQSILSAEYRLPAKRGDILAAVRDGATIIGLIDGSFHQDAAVAHREILAAIRAGVTVTGSSSMGALRAAEMDTLGMKGIGEIYRKYASGELVSDDEVALVFDPVSGTALSEPLINIRYTLDAAGQQGIITQENRAALLDAAKSLFYPSRTYPGIVAAAGDAVERETGEKFLLWTEENRCDQKRADAIALLEYIRDLPP